MSSLPPVGNKPIPGEEPVKGDLSETFGKSQIDRRRGRTDRRMADQSAGGGRRTGAADRRVQTESSVQTSGEERTGEKEPLHLQDDQGHLQPNPKATDVRGVSDAERTADAVSRGTPLGTKEIENIGVPVGGVAVASRVQGSTTVHESGEVRAGIGEVRPNDDSQSGSGEALASERPSAEATATDKGDPSKNPAAIGDGQEAGEEGSETDKKRGHLPEGFPGLAALEEAGEATYTKVRKRIDAGTLTEIPNIGDATAEKIEEAYNAPATPVQ